MSLTIARRRLYKPGLLVPAYALVGAAGTVVSGSSVTPTWGAGAARTIGNILICVISGTAAVNPMIAPSTPSTWTSAVNRLDTTSYTTSSIFYKIATGADSAPTFGSQSGVTWYAKLFEFSGNATSSILNWQQSNAGVSSPYTLTLGGTDTATGELVIVVGTSTRTVGATDTMSHSVNNATLTSDNNNAATSVNHYNFGYGITTANASADVDTFSFGGSVQGSSAVMATFRHG